MWRVALLLVALLQVLPTGANDHVIYTDDIAVEIAGDEVVADLVAGTHSCRIKRQLKTLGNIYVFNHPEMKKRSKRSADHILERLRRDPNVKYAEQQRILTREKRRAGAYREHFYETERKRPIVYDKQLELPIRVYHDPSVYQRFSHESSSRQSREFTNKDAPTCSVKFKDPMFRDQWYLVNHGQAGGPAGYDVNVQCVWKHGFTGKGVVVSILDDGLDHTHPDLQQNYDARASNNFNDNTGHSKDPMPNLADSSNTHGTRCAGEVAATANNSVCGVGIAFNAKIGGVKILDGPVTDSLEAEALLFENQYIDIYSASWGPRDNGRTMEGPHHFCKQALQKGAEEGRGGLGSIFVWATGNGGLYGDTCSCDGYVSNIYTLSIGCISDEGLSTYFTEVCPSTMAVIFTGGSHVPPGEKQERRPKIKVVTTDPLVGCTLEFQGTSSAAPLAAGAFALVLEANPTLTWRDMQHIVVQTARIPTGKEAGWMRNGAGFHVNPSFGFGVLDCSLMTEAAQSWHTVPTQHVCTISPDNDEAELKSNGSITQTLETDGCQGDRQHAIYHLEHVEVNIELEHGCRGQVNMFLRSPQGMRSEILRVRPEDDSTQGIHFTFMTVFNWGENPRGKWTLEVYDRPFDNSEEEPTGRLLSWGLTLYGTAEKPHLMSDMPSMMTRTSEKHTNHARRMTTVELERSISLEASRAENAVIRRNSEAPGSWESDESGESSRSKHRSTEKRLDDDDMGGILNVIEQILNENEND